MVDCKHAAGVTSSGCVWCKMDALKKELAEAKAKITAYKKDAWCTSCGKGLPNGQGMIAQARREGLELIKRSNKKSFYAHEVLETVECEIRRLAAQAPQEQETDDES